MSDDILTASQYSLDYLQSPVDDLFSFYYTMQWAAVFHDQEFAARDIPFHLKILRETFWDLEMIDFSPPTKLLPLHLLDRMNAVHS